MTIPALQPAYSAGEFAPALYGRVDLSRFHTAASTMRNFFVNYRGGAMTRAGTAFIGQCKQSGSAAPPRDIKFQFNVTQSYALEFGDLYMRVKTNGGYVTEPPLTITGATQANPCAISVTNSFSSGDLVFISGVGGMTQLNGLNFVVATRTPSTITLKSPFTGLTIDAMQFGAYVSGGTVARIYTLATPYAAVDLPYLKFTQSADVMSLCCVNQITLAEYLPYDLTRQSPSAWTLTAVNFVSSINPPATATLTASTTTNSNATQYQAVITAVNQTTGEESIASPIATASLSVDISQTLGSLTAIWSASAGAGSYNIYLAPAAFNATVPAGSAFGYIGSAFGLSFVDNNITPNFTVSPPLHRNPFARGQVLAVPMSAVGSGYQQSSTTVTVNTATGSGAKLAPIVANGQVGAVIVQGNGGGYAPGDTVTIGSSPIAGAILTFTLTAQGTGYSLPYVVISDATGSGAQILINQVGGFVNFVSIVVNGSGYTAPTVQIFDQAGGSGAGATATVTFGTLPAGTGATATLTLGSQTGTYPGVPAYFQQRRFYANTTGNPDTYYASQPGAFLNFDSAIPATASDAITGTPWAQQVNGIQAMVPMPSGLVILTGLGAWQLSGGAQGTAVTPATQDATPQAYNGCSPIVPPITREYDILYVQEKGSIVRSLAYNFFVNIYTGTDRTTFSSHLFEGHTIVQWASCEEPYKIIWAVRDDGVLLSFTYIKDQEIFAWARHDTNGFVVSVCAVSEPPVDALYMIVKRYVKGQWVYYSERMNNRIWNAIEDSWCVDCGLNYPMPKPAATLTVSSATGVGTITGVNLIAGGSGYVAPVVTVSDPTGTGATFSATVLGGIITNIAVVTGGANYSGTPQLQITDAAGSGAVGQALASNLATFSTSPGVFVPSSVGSVIRCGNGKATITQYTGGSTAIAAITQPITALVPNDPNATPVPFNAGQWTMTAPTSVVSGLNHLEGLSVACLADGSVVANQTVTNGAIALPQPATAIVVGLPFQAQLQSLYLDAQSPATIQGRRKNVYAVTMRVENTRGIKVGSNQPDAATQPGRANVPWTKMTEIKQRNNSVFAGNAIPLYTGDLRAEIAAAWKKGGQVAVQQDYPLPCTVLASVAEAVVGDDPG